LATGDNQLGQDGAEISTVGREFSLAGRDLARSNAIQVFDSFGSSLIKLDWTGC
jgi:hypothetical protein